MKHILSNIITTAIAALGLASCSQMEHDTEPLADPWTRERTPVNVRLEGQIGAAAISDDWRNDAVGTISVSLITASLDLSKVKVVALDFQFPDSEFCPSSSLKAGDTVDLTSGSTTFVVTAYNGETRTYTLRYEVFSDPLVGTYVHEPVAGILDATNAPKCSSIIAGGWTGAYVISQTMDKYWQWDAVGTEKPTAENDNIISFMLTDADAETGLTRGTLLNLAGDDGLYANYTFKGVDDVNHLYRILPKGASRWAKDEAGKVHIYAKEDVNYENSLYSFSILTAGDCKPIAEYDKTFTIPTMAFARNFTLAKEDEVVDNNWPDTRWMRDNFRFSCWLVKRSSDSPVDGHAAQF